MQQTFSQDLLLPVSLLILNLLSCSSAPKDQGHVNARNQATDQRNLSSSFPQLLWCVFFFFSKATCGLTYCSCCTHELDIISSSSLTAALIGFDIAHNHLLPTPAATVHFIRDVWRRFCSGSECPQLI